MYVAGTVFLSDFEISDSSSVDYGDASYANKTIISNILSGLLKEQTVSKIADVRANNTAGTVFYGRRHGNRWQYRAERFL